MGVGPSAQDETQFDQLANTAPEFYLRGIVNKNGDAKFDVIFPKMNVKITDLPWEVEQAPMQLDALIAAITGASTDKQILYRDVAKTINTFATTGDPARTEFWRKEVKEKVKGFTWAAQQGGGYQGNSYAALPGTPATYPQRPELDDDWRTAGMYDWAKG